jgi:flagellar L-ring protein precursor FlgH
MNNRVQAMLRKVLPMVVMLGAAALCPLTAQSLYTESTYHPLASDNKAYRVGDVITVQVLENSSASTSTDTNTQRNGNVTLAAGLSTTNRSQQLNANLGAGGTFDGGGTTQRANKLLAILSVSVKEVLSNGDLRLEGEQLLTVNGEKHKVHLAGKVRPQDISTDNIVLSTRLADASIVYDGDGDLSERQKRSWWQRCLNWVGL